MSAVTGATTHPVTSYEDGSFTVPTLPVTRPALLAHIDRFGLDAQLVEVAGWEGFELARPKARRNERRIGEVQRLHEEHLPLEEIASRTGLSLQTVRKYVSMPRSNGLFKRQNVQSPASKPGGRCGDSFRPWTTPRSAALGERILALHEDGLSVMAISDRLGKSDRVVRRYLREYESRRGQGREPGDGRA